MKKILFSFLFIFALASCGGVTPIPALISTPAITPFSNPDADEAQELITKSEKALLALGNFVDNSNYLAVEYAARDALSRFPNDPRAATWKWKMAYYAILAGDTQFGNDIYADLITTALDSGETDVNTMSTWFQSGELENTTTTATFKLKVEKIAIKGQDKKYLINIISDLFGSSCFLTVQSSQKYSTFFIHNGFAENGFAMMRYDTQNCELKDLTNDGNDEVVVENYTGGHVGYSSFRVVDISTIPPRPLPFADQNGEDVFFRYESVQDFPVSNGKNQIQTIERAPNCQVGLEWIFEWNGIKFAPVDMNFQADTRYAPLKDCLIWASIYARGMGLEVGVKIINQALEQYEPVAVNDQDYERLDEIKVDKALLYLFAGHSDEARTAFQELIQHPYQKNGVWAESARKFLTVYKDPSDLYKACSVLVVCTRDAFYYLINNQFKDLPLNSLVDSLQHAGVDIVSSGWLDLDYDGIDELWFVVVPPDKTENSLNEIWIASGYPYGNSVFSYAPGLQGETPDFHTERLSNNEVLVKYSKEWAFIWSRDSVTNEPSLKGILYPSKEYYLEEVDTAKLVNLRHKLQSGADPYEIYVEYMNLKKDFDTNPLLECEVCDFNFGYIAELVGDKKTATEMYSKLIELYPDHPLASLAKSKLKK